MKITSGFNGKEAALADLFASAFTDAEGEAEGAEIKHMVAALLATTPAADIVVFRAESGDQLIAAGIFTRLSFAQDQQEVFLLSPMAVATVHQGQGVGQRLLGHALAGLRNQGVDAVMTYGDPAFYGKLGFVPVTPQQVRPPLPLSMPHGWIGRKLAQDFTQGTAPVLQGESTCVAGLNRPNLW